VNIDELVELQRAADLEHGKLDGRDGAEHETQWKAWRNAAETVQVAVTEYARRNEKPRSAVEDEAKRKARHPER
jgi:hypothetical protein